MECSLLLRMFDVACEIFDCPCVDLFVMRANAKLPIYRIPVLGPMVWRQRILSTSMELSEPPLALLRQVL